LAAAVGEKLAKAKGLRPAEGAVVLREALDAVMGKGKPATPLWDRLGGEKAVRELVREAGTAAATDPKLNFTRNGAFKLDEKGVARMEQLLVEYVSEKTGGPLKYTGKDLKATHAGMKITEDEFNVLLNHVAATLGKHKVPQAEADELLAVVAATKGLVVEVPKKPLWDRLGGETGVRAVVREFLSTAGKDPKANVDRGGNYPFTKERTERVEQLAVELISSVSGGPLKYTGRDMKNTHQGMRITEAEFDAVAGHLVAALKKFNVPQADIDELLGVIAPTKKDIVEKK
jgi:hemoglobin